MNVKPTYRLAEGNSFCRICDKSLQRKADHVISWYSHRNRGQWIHICPECVANLQKLLPESE